MDSNDWKKVENEAGYPIYVSVASGVQQYNHPQFESIIDSLKQYQGIKDNLYRIACKVHALQKQLRVPPVRITSGVFARHQLSLSESSLSLDATELEAVLADIYFAAEKEGLFTGDIDLAVDLVINLMLNVYDRDRKEPIRVLAAKSLLIILSEESCADKWLALANCAADHNGCVSPKRLGLLLGCATSLCNYLGDDWNTVDADVEACFARSSGMLGLTSRFVADWAAANCASARWLAVVQRLQHSRVQATIGEMCSACRKPVIQMLTFKCAKCKDVYLCEKCYLYDVDLSAINGHKKTHTVDEILSTEAQPSECLSFMKGMRRFFFCTKTKKKKTIKSSSKKSTSTEKGTENTACDKKKKDGRPAIFTSTVGKASGNNKNNPTVMLQDIIAQLESQHKVWKNLTEQLQSSGQEDKEALKTQVDAQWSHITTQINRLKLLQENIALTSPSETTEQPNEKPDRIQAFDLFSPIAAVDEEKQSRITDNPKTQPRVLSLDSGNFSVVSKQTSDREESNNLLTVTSDGLKPVASHATSDSISTVSMNDISNWYNETHHKPADFPSHSLCISEQKFDSDLRAVASSNDKMRELNHDLDAVLDRLHAALARNITVDDSCFDNSQLRETATEMEGLLGSLIRGVEQRATLNHNKGMV
ncbi:dystrophin-1 [Plutella xylostella]|uniref:dystrophin-1 n=1 Tax=Plutella xylostella TaxID=51655 RepID=UPI0020326C6B|nr:dystrophin-1 [Plutella xylostella]